MHSIARSWKKKLRFAWQSSEQNVESKLFRDPTTEASDRTALVVA